MTNLRPRFMTVTDAAAELDTSRDSVYRWLRATTPEVVARQTLRIRSGTRTVPTLVVDVNALGRYADGLSIGRPRKS